MITYGPCQTPTLGFCVDQAEKIKKFVTETYWRIEAKIVDEKGKLESDVHYPWKIIFRASEEIKNIFPDDF